MKTEVTTQANEICRISQGTTIEGTIVSLSDIRIDGSFNGTIATKGKLVVGESAHIKGTIVCENVDVWGNVEGDVIVGDSFSLKASSDLKGTLKTSRISVEVGAIFNGSCQIISVEEFQKLSKDYYPVSTESAS